ncbi:MAG: DUF5615 family PIN-like protein [Planktothrix sp. GU0601_MAG3]|nr:MAG: DUF5615 family PIN-like protein [Planktothrix sp. GU0601_MAG3]
MLKYLIDENIDPIYTRQLRRFQSDLFVIAVGELTAPPKGTLDPEILCWCEENQCILVTNNRKSMPVSSSRSYRFKSSYPWDLYPQSKVKYW